MSRTKKGRQGPKGKKRKSNGSSSSSGGPPRSASAGASGAKSSKAAPPPAPPPLMAHEDLEGGAVSLGPAQGQMPQDASSPQPQMTTAQLHLAQQLMLIGYNPAAAAAALSAASGQVSLPAMPSHGMAVPAPEAGVFPAAMFGNGFSTGLNSRDVALALQTAPPLPADGSAASYDVLQQILSAAGVTSSQAPPIWQMPMPSTPLGPLQQHPSVNTSSDGAGGVSHRPYSTTAGVNVLPIPDATSSLRKEISSSSSSVQTPPPSRSQKTRERRRASRKDDRDAIVPPSQASGGVPDPTSAYLLRASFAPIRVSTARPLLIVMDLNGTLLYRPNKRQPTTFVARPHARTFLNYLTSVFWVAVWSSARPGNVSAMINELLPEREQRERLVTIWSRDHFGLTRDDYNRRVQCYKRLAMIWDDPLVAASHPDFATLGTRWGQGDTVLVDDSTEKARSEPHNLVCVPDFVGDEREDPPVLPQVHDYINELCYHKDVSTYIRENPFTALAASS